MLLLLECAADRVVRALEPRCRRLEVQLLVGQRRHFLFGIHGAALSGDGRSGRAAGRKREAILVHLRGVGHAIGDLSMPQRALVEGFPERAGRRDAIDEVEERHDPEPR